MRHVIDLRSDTVTKPTPEMRRAMSVADVGDDVYGEDPTVRALEERAAEITGKDAALFVPTGTMGNQVALKAWTQPGQQVIAEERSHVFMFELGAMAMLSGLMPNPIPSKDGSFTPQDVQNRLYPPVYYLMKTGLVVVEDTHNMAGGTIFPMDKLAAVYNFCRSRGIPVHMDGARVFNASIALNVPVKDITAHADSVMFCLSKGLACPVGSLLCGPSDFIHEARIIRKRFGGGMRQVGILAAAGIVALDSMVERLVEDHLHARKLAEIFKEFSSFTVNLENVQTNILIVETNPELNLANFMEYLQKHGVLALTMGGNRIRMVTHYQIVEEDLIYIRNVMYDYFKNLEK